jgi:hypothetical protein
MSAREPASGAKGNGSNGPLVTLRGFRHHGDVASEFRPGHPLSFWLLILVLIYGIYSGLFAMSHVEDCRDRGSTEQHWELWPPGWVCDG